MIFDASTKEISFIVNSIVGPWKEFMDKENDALIEWLNALLHQCEEESKAKKGKV